MINDRWFRGVRITPERQRVWSAMVSYDEGLGPRAYRCILQLADGRQPTPADVDWLTDGIEEPSLARRGPRGCELTAYGRLLANAADRGDATMVFALTTMPELLSERAN